MIADALTGVRRSLTEKSAEQDKFQATADARFAELNAAVEAATATITEKTAAVATAQEHLDGKKALTTEAKANLATAKGEQKDLDAKIEGLEFDLEKFTRGQDELLTGLLTNGPDKKILKVFL